VLPIPLPAAFVYEVLCNLPVDELEAENLDSDDLADATRADEGVVSNVSEAPTILNSHTIISTVHIKMQRRKFHVLSKLHIFVHQLSPGDVNDLENKQVLQSEISVCKAMKMNAPGSNRWIVVFPR
jgi:hypothetical protein